MRRPLFHGVRAKRGSGWLPVSMIVRSETNPVPRSARPRLTRDTIIYKRRLRLKKADLRVPLRSCSPDAPLRHSPTPECPSQLGGFPPFAKAWANGKVAPKAVISRDHEPSGGLAAEADD